MTVTRIVASKGLNAAKLARLAEIAKRLGAIRAEVWRRYGALNGNGRTYFNIRDEWMREGRKFDVPARLWKETLNDVLADIGAYRAAAKQAIHGPIFRRTERIAKEKGWNKERLDAERKRIFTLLKGDQWASDPYLHHMMRKHFRHGCTQVDTHIKLDSGCYDWFKHGDMGWIAVMSLESGKRIAIPLASNHPISGTIRLIIKEDGVEVHHTIEAPPGEPCGDRTIGIDKGYTEVFVDSDGDRHGVDLGKVLSKQTDRNNLKYQRRNRIRAIAEKSSPCKRDRIFKNNLGRIKLNRKRDLHTQEVKTICCRAANTVVDKASIIATEDLTAVIRSRGKGKAKKGEKKPRFKGPQEKRRLAGWVKGLMATALESVSHRRGSAVRLVNSAYTSQVHSTCRCLARRDGDVLHCDVCRDVAPSDREAAREVLARLNDHEIGRWTPFKQVKSILQERTSRYRLRLSSQDSSWSDVDSTESEKPPESTGNCG